MHIKLLDVCRKEDIMINLKNNKTKRVVAAVIVVILILAMVLPMAVSALISNRKLTKQ